MCLSVDMKGHVHQAIQGNVRRCVIIYEGLPRCAIMQNMTKCASF